MNIDLILSKLENVKDRGNNQWMARCPAHKDDKNSLSVGLGEKGTVLLHCFAGCDYAKIKDALGLKSLSSSTAQGSTPDGPIVATYDYVDENGTLLYQVCRHDPKAFKPRRPDGRGGCCATKAHNCIA